MKAEFWIGVGILAFLLVSFFVPIQVPGPSSITNDTLLGILIFHNVIVLAIYVLIGLAFIFFGLGKIKLV